MSQLRNQLLDVFEDLTPVKQPIRESEPSVIFSEWKDLFKIGPVVFSRNTIDETYRVSLVSDPIVITSQVVEDEDAAKRLSRVFVEKLREPYRLIEHFKALAYKNGFYLIETRKLPDEHRYIFENSDGEELHICRDKTGVWWETLGSINTNPTSLKERLSIFDANIEFPRWFNFKPVTLILTEEEAKDLPLKRAVCLEHPRLGHIVLMGENLDLIDGLLDESFLSDLGRTYGGAHSPSVDENIFVMSQVIQDDNACPSCHKLGLCTSEISENRMQKCCMSCGYQSESIKKKSLGEDGGFGSPSSMSQTGVVTGQVKPRNDPGFPGETNPVDMVDYPVGPADTDSHTHTGWINQADGNGYTSSDKGHNHQIVNLQVVPGMDGHQHSTIYGYPDSKGGGSDWSSKTNFVQQPGRKDSI